MGMAHFVSSDDVNYENPVAVKAKIAELQMTLFGYRTQLLNRKQIVHQYPLNKLKMRSEMNSTPEYHAFHMKLLVKNTESVSGRTIDKYTRKDRHA